MRIFNKIYFWANLFKAVKSILASYHRPTKQSWIITAMYEHVSLWCLEHHIYVWGCIPVVLGSSVLCMSMYTCGAWSITFMYGDVYLWCLDHPFMYKDVCKPVAIGASPDYGLCPFYSSLSNLYWAVNV